ncbi:guanine nucleotide exchange factor MSS4 homolog [Aethina tumida]|uniref:guanine nucleotide exchange factor MSS4 homolog n=1 Tax=Aethina tumida TaxID=116153 RepID=UPI00096B2DE8|nr:guanine nucleotide exchange factor MSS4 homolog [Aethina tumida]
MPDCSENYETEISDGRNARNVKCQECGCLILKPSIASFTNLEFNLPLHRQSKLTDATNPETESLSLFWSVDDVYKFENLAFSNTVGNNKYLICADCEAGPIGFFDIRSGKSYVALSRVQHC